MRSNQRVTMMEKTRRTFLGTAALATAAGVTGTVTASDSDDTIHFVEDFDDVSRTWFLDADLPQNFRYGRDWDIYVGNDTAVEGDRSLEYRLDATQGHGTIWAATPVQVEPGHRYMTEVDVSCYTEFESFNKLSTFRAYVGPERPVETGDFPNDQQAFRVSGPFSGLLENPWTDEGWNDYSIFWETPELDTDEVWLAFAIQSGWETEIGHGLDAVEFTMERK